MRSAMKPLLMAFVFLASGAAAWFFGLVAGEAYAIQLLPRAVDYARPVLLIGQCWGAATGLMAAGLWWRVIVARTRRTPQRRSWSGPGAWVGIRVGVLSTVLLHGVLVAVSDRFEPIVVAVGIVCGVIAGAVVGAICGALVGWVERSATTPGAGADVPKDGIGPR